MNEKFLQKKIWHWRIKHGHKLVVPNSRLFYGESDVLSITKTDFAYTHEIKISKSDFKAEFNGVNRCKWLWHDTLKKVFESKKYYAASAVQVPNYYLFVCPDGLILPEEIPEYAGLVYWTNGDAPRLAQIVKPPRIHKEIVTQVQKDKLGVSLMWRYWTRCQALD